MFHLDRGRSGVDLDVVRDEIGFTISADGNDVRELEEDMNDFFPQTRVPLESRSLVQAKLRHQPLDLPFLEKSVKLSMPGSLRGRGVVRMEYHGRGGDLLDRSHKGPWLQVNIFAFQIVDHHRQAAVSLNFLQDWVVTQEGPHSGLNEH